MSNQSTNLERVESYQFPRAHYGHLSDQQNRALENFKALCQQKGYYSPAGPGVRASHDDETLLRYLRARKFLPRDAFQQFKDTEDWRKENKLDELYDTIDIHDYDETRRLYPQWTGRRDKRGIPLYVFEVAGLNAKRMSEYEHSTAKSQSAGNVSVKLMRLFALYENLVRFTMPLCSGIPNRPHPETPISQSNNIVDISSVGLKQFWNLKAHMQDASQLATAHYPETLDRIFVIGAPSFFPTVWSWVKRWFDPITVSKIFILSHQNMKSTLEQYIDPANIPKKYGGKLNWDWGSLPNLDPAIENALTWKHPVKSEHGQNVFPPGPVKWMETPEGDMVALAVGSERGRQRNQEVAVLHSQHRGVATGGKASNFGQPSTSGLHTHPEDNMEYFQPSGNTPPYESDEPQIHHTSRPGGRTVPVYGPNFQSTQGASSLGYVDSLPNSYSAQTLPGSDPRQQLSYTRYEQHNQNHDFGQMEAGTPADIDHGYGDRTTIAEPSTVGQARKNVEVPYAERAHTHGDESYFGQAKAVADSAYATTTAAVGAASNTVMSAIGYGGRHESEVDPSNRRVEPERKAEDPRVDRMDNNAVEDFIRSQYTTHDNPGHNRHQEF